MQAEKIGSQVVGQELALDSYLSILLDEIPSNNELDQIEMRKEILKPVQRIQKTVTQISNNEKQVNALKPLSVMPGWAQNEFQALFFKVDTLILATPLTDLLRTIKLEKKPTSIPNQPGWFLGLLDTHGQRIGVLDTGQLIYGKLRGQQRDLSKQPFQRILITHDGKWGLACDEILTIAKLEPDKVRWRTLRSKKPWLIGTVIDELTAIVDVNFLVPRRKAS